LLDWARKRAIQTIFWNKEDPVHFERFLERARLFSHVFTTDANCISEYRVRLGHDRVDVLPFAAQPSIHHPIEAENRDGAVCFAGTYYGNRHEQRRSDMDFILRPAIPFGLEIYDRQFGVKGYSFPEVYQNCIKGRLDYEDMVKAYKRYRVFLNVNSVKQSPTMFSRRVFELLACGTPVISTYSQGIVELLGEDVVAFTQSESDTRRHLERLLGDDEEWAIASARGIRKVMSKHTYGHRLVDALQRTNISLPSPREPRITVVIRVETEARLMAVASQLAAQCYRQFDVVLLTQAAISSTTLEQFRNALSQHSVRVAIGSPDEICQQCVQWVADYAALLDMRDYYGPSFLIDYSLAMRYSHADFMGKKTHYDTKGRGGQQLMQAGNEYRYVNSVPSGTLIVKRSSLSSDLLQTALFRHTVRLGEQRILSINRFNYLRNEAIHNALANGQSNTYRTRVEV
jgi:hypothetical protein